MLYLLRKIFTALFFIAVCSSSIAQDLEYIPPVITKHPSKDSTISFILSADSPNRTYSKQNRPYTCCAQIIDADQPWPPRWFSAAPVYSDEEAMKDTARGYLRQDYIEDVRIVAGHFSFFKILSKPPMEQPAVDSPELDAYMLLNEKMECVDTVSSLTAFRNLYFHDISIDAKGNKLVSLRKDTYLDLRDYTNNQADRSRHCGIDIIEELDSKDSVLLSWNPLYHLDPSLFRFKELLADQAFANGGSDIIQWTRLTSAQWDYDGNILYSMKNLGIGKISLADGHVMWQINYNQIPMMSGKDTIRWYCQHDFNYLYQTDTSAIYSLYSNGLKAQSRDTNILVPSCGILFELNKKTLKVKLLHSQHPHARFVASGQGGYDWKKNGEYVVSYGFLKQPISPNSDFSETFEYGKQDGSYSIYMLPRNMTCFKAHKLENFKRPPRPVIARKNDELEVVDDGAQDYTWYRLSGSNNTIIDKVGTGKTLKYGDGGTFCVAEKYGIGYAVSKAFTVAGNSPY